jgi:threonine aldolase
VQRIDLRSDTITRPTPLMREAMALAEVGDDVFGEDPTVAKLQEVAAERMGKEAALFMPSGCMANQVAIRLQTSPGEEVLLEQRGHSIDWELGGAAALSGVQLRPLRSDGGIVRPEHIAEYIEPRPYYRSRVTMLILENTHNMAGGRAVPVEELAATAGSAANAGLATHLDGARLFNAAVALGVDAAEFAAPFDTVMFSLSKGLSAPVGSLLCGPAPLIEEARRVRKMFGGGMRQAGVLAAAGLVALQHGIDRLADDHATARRLAEGIVSTGRVSLAYGHVDTNIVVVDVAGMGTTAERFVSAAEAVGVICASVGPSLVRFVTHRHVNDEIVDEALRRLEPVLG